MKHIVSFSGGRTSAYLVYLMEEKRKQKNLDVEYVFMDTGAEADETYDFVKKCVEYFNIELTVLKTVIHPELGVGPTFSVHTVDDIGWDLSVFKAMTKKHGNPYAPSGGFCTDKLKTVTFNKYVKSLNTPYTTWIGIRADEPKRLKPKPNIWYLADISPFEKDDVLDFWKSMPFDLELNEWLGNCIFCIKKGVNKVALAMRERPEKAKEWNEMCKQAKVNSEELGPDVMYRGKLSMDGIAKFYEDYSTEEILKTIRGRKIEDSGCGSSSCEVFSNEEVNFF